MHTFICLCLHFYMYLILCSTFVIFFSTRIRYICLFSVIPCIKNTGTLRSTSIQCLFCSSGVLVALWRYYTSLTFTCLSVSWTFPQHFVYHNRCIHSYSVNKTVIFCISKCQGWSWLISIIRIIANVITAVTRKKSCPAQYFTFLMCFPDLFRNVSLSHSTFLRLSLPIVNHRFQTKDKQGDEVPTIYLSFNSDDPMIYDIT